MAAMIGRFLCRRALTLACCVGLNHVSTLTASNHMILAESPMPRNDKNNGEDDVEVLRSRGEYLCFCEL